MKEGDVVSCIVSQLGSYGFYAIIDDQNKDSSVFVNFGELSWKRIRKTEEVVSIGDRVKVKLCKEPSRDGSYYLGSLKRAYPEANPWVEPFLYETENAYEGRVCFLGKDFLLVELGDGVSVAVKDAQLNQYQIDDKVQVFMTKILLEEQKLYGRLIQ
ncbi:Hypothetical protein PBC10988_18300 [Planctomycetales bacterium 10988]|nr:Hypothetical protein PBC10988_18300 [Planctomycetales bacterium 10988]